MAITSLYNFCEDFVVIWNLAHAAYSCNPMAASEVSFAEVWPECSALFLLVICWEICKYNFFFFQKQLSKVGELQTGAVGAKHVLFCDTERDFYDLSATSLVYTLDKVNKIWGKNSC